jgi:TusA-related sulfurtransferase
MRRAALSWVVVFASMAIGGCDEQKPAPTAQSSAPEPAKTASAAPEAAATAPSAAPSAHTPGKGKMANCPNAVEGAATEFKDVDKGIEILVTAKTEAATQDIRRRAKHMATVSKEATRSSKTHDGSGQGGGQFGRCPVVLKNTKVDAADVEGGAKLTVVTDSEKELDWLRREVRERQANLSQPGAEGAGTGKMQHCPSAVVGATTAVKETKGGAVITVTAKDDEAVKDIRARAKHLVEAAKKDPKAVKHDGTGEGGGGLGRCPVVLRETKVEAKEVAGGAEISVIAEKPDYAEKIVKEARERAEKFAVGAAPAPSGSASAGPAEGAPKKKKK